jgi:hypothetical protein
LESDSYQHAANQFDQAAEPNLRTHSGFILSPPAKYLLGTMRITA